MCTYQTTMLAIRGSGKGPTGWFRATDAMVSFDHPTHALDEHTLNVDLLNPALGPDRRVALELDVPSARALAEAILAALDGLPEAIRGD